MKAKPGAGNNFPATIFNLPSNLFESEIAYMLINELGGKVKCYLTLPRPMPSVAEDQRKQTHRGPQFRRL